MMFDSSAGARDIKNARPANYAASEKKGQKSHLSESTVSSSATLTRQFRIFRGMPITSKVGPFRSASVGRNLLLRSLAEGVAFFRAVDAVEHEHRTRFLDRLKLLFVYSIPERHYLLIWRL
jgi:hypothetical protein